MAAKKNASKGDPRGRPTQPELIAALTEAGYTLDGFSRKGETLVVRLTPTDLTDKPSGYPKAFDVTDALGLQARCHVFAQVPQDLLILSVNLPETKAVADPQIKIQKSEIKN